MKIQDFGTLQMVRTDKAHFGQGKIQPLTANIPGMSPIEKLNRTEQTTEAASIQRAGQSKSFQSYLLDALSTVNSQQLDVTAVQEKLITDPDDVDIHDVTIAMAKARQSLNLAQTVIDRLVTGWNEITTTR
ncbi:flagellar hook-basal body complex protein FliE [Treponema bryantii]|jgi:flagellar hook-basal body complex protein FliE|uniref:Flagellar hook-basal body complex protein FliE n=1 Tax=Treponema bryantii TaxID=163 RepID=A0A1H9A4G3_9SPIR|nr:flagellar hook-basal body complex protein FliE [Treponema bryantii]SEP71626.1 flagellar hook-basal body complex protein FliE [Treponema bryantii]